MDGKNVEDLYPLSPMQQGMLFHTLEAPGSGVYVEQVSCALRGDLDVPAFERAWREMVRRHAILRTGVLGEGLKEPVQVVHREVELPLERQDWLGASESEQRARLEALLESDRRRGFDLSRPPLMRLMLIRRADRVHELVWSFHHLLLDGWSMPLLMQDVLALYEAFRQGKPPVLEARRPYRDYIAWLRRQDLTRAEAFWRGELAGFDEPTSLGVGPGIRDGGGAGREFAEESLQLTPEATRDLQALARRHGLTLSTVVQGAWALLLGRYGGRRDVVFGVTVSGRPAELPGSGSMLGLFINTLPLRVGIREDMPLAGWLQSIQARAVEMRQYEHSPLLQVHGWSEVPRGTPLFESILVFENFPLQAALAGGDDSLSIGDARSEASTNYPLTVIASAGERLAVEIAYDVARFDGATVRRMLQHLRVLLEGMAGDPQRRLRELPMLTEAERRQVLVEWNDTSVEYPRERCVHELFEEWVERTPDAVAVVCEDRSLTYRELDRRANQLAHHLRSAGVGPGMVVGLVGERSTEAVAALLAILKAGAAYLPLDPGSPRERLAFMLADAGAPLVIAQRRSAGLLPDEGPRAVLLDADAAEIEAQPDSAPRGRVGAEDLAYVMYTSGSTGVPKGVQVQHRSINRLVRGIDYARLGPDRTLLHAAPLAFDASTFELWGALLNGGRCAIHPEQVPTARGVGASIRRHGVTTAFLTTALFNALVDEEPAQLAGLEELLTGGESISVPHVRRALAALPGTEIIHVYGPTETTTFATSYRIPRDLGAEASTIPVGQPIGNTTLYVLDGGQGLAPVGAAGELFIGGDGVARGYLNRPELTAERFLPDPFSDRPGARMYRTGDRVRWLPDGSVEFLGRFDDQVKVRGFRIEPGEIEVALSRHPAVRQAVVVAREHGKGDLRLAAYVVPRDGSSLAAGDLRDFLQRKLPPFMVPSSFVLLAELPLTQSGKVDRKALPAPQGAAEGRYVAPRTPTEELLAGLWCDVLGLERVGVEDDFFELGGHSLTATRLASRLRSALGAEVPLRELFEAPTVAALARRVELARRAAPGRAEPPIVPVPRDGELPLSFAQQRLWFLDQLGPQGSSYVIPLAVRFTGALDVATLERCLEEIVRRHEALRTTFETVDGRARQVIAPDAAVELAVDDLRHLPGAERESEALRLAAEHAARRFDLARGPLLRAHLFRLQDDEHIALLAMHHIVTDGWSMGVLFDELVQLYRAFRAGRPSPLRPLPVQYADFAVWQREWLKGDVLESQLAHWKERLAGSPPLLELPTDRPRPAVQAGRGASYDFALPASLARAVKAFGRKEGATLFMTLLAAFQALLHRYTGSESVNVGTPIANRNRAEIEGLIGFFVNTLVMRAAFSDAPSFRELLRRTRESSLAAYAHQDLPFEKLVDALEIERHLSHSPLFQVMFALQNAPAPDVEIPELTVAPVDLGLSATTFDLTLTMGESADGMAASLEYDADLFDEATIRRMASHFQLLLGRAVADPDRPISQLDLLGDEERRLVVEEWNRTEADCPRERCVHELFEEQVERTPDAVAVGGDGRSLSYRELNERANRLARRLQGLGVRPGRLVGLVAERAPETLVGLLAILKAGAAYVPLDPAYPRDRVARVLEDARVPVLVGAAAPPAAWRLAGVELLRLDDPSLAAELARESEENPASGAGPEDLAYVIYTSGSTGRPKGVMISHRSALNLWAGLRREIYEGPRREGLRVSLNASLAFDASVQQILTLLGGHTLHVLSQEVRLDGEALVAYVRRHRLDVLDCVPTQLKLMLEAGLLEGDEWRPSILFSGGEAIDEATWQALARAEGVAVHNMYGPTECTVAATSCRIGREGRGPSIGRPLANVRAYVLDGRLQPVPVGVPGELCIGGEGVGQGYLNRPELTRERFLLDPFASREGARMYRTGDRVRWREDGELEYLGRLDGQVKLRGYRIELGEVEAALLEQPSVGEAAVVVREDGEARRLVAYLVGRDPERTPEAGSLREALRERLPEYMVPSAFVALPALPRTPSGKLDRKALPAPQAQEGRTDVYVAPRTPEELALAGIWAQLLGVERVGVHDGFFDLGGESILAIQLVSRAARAGLKLTAAQVFQSPTLEQMARAAVAVAPAAAEQGLVTGEVDLTPIQRWLLEQDLRDPHHWNMSMLVAVEDGLDVPRLRAAVAHLLGHHDELRARFERTPSGWRQTIPGAVDPASFCSIDLSALPEEELPRAIESHAARLQESLDLAAGPLFRVAHFNLGPGRSQRLLLLSHHLVVDVVSWRILLDDLEALYRQLGRGEPARLPPRTTSFQTWARRMVELARSPRLGEELAFWRRLASRGARALPVDHPEGENTYGDMDQVVIALDPAEADSVLRAAPRRLDRRVDEVLLAALLTALSRWTGESRLLVEMEAHGRENLLEGVDVSRTVGWFTASSPLLLDTGGERDPEGVLARVSRAFREVPNHGIGYGLLRYLSEDPGVRDELRAIEPQVSFNYLGRFEPPVGEESLAVRLAPERRGPEYGPGGRRRKLLDVVGMSTSGGLNLVCLYSRRQYDRATIEDLMADFGAALRAYAAFARPMGPPSAGALQPRGREACSAAAEWP